MADEDTRSPSLPAPRAAEAGHPGRDGTHTEHCDQAQGTGPTEPALRHPQQPQSPGREAAAQCMWTSVCVSAEPPQEGVRTPGDKAGL